MHHVGHVDCDFSESPAGYAGSAAGDSSSSLVGSHTGAVHTSAAAAVLLLVLPPRPRPGYSPSSFHAAAPV
jgi:hypothetical protein